MELGTTICTPTRPTCFPCLVVEYCNSFSIIRRYDSNNEHAMQSLYRVYNAVEVVTYPSITSYPMKILKPMPREEFAAVCVVEMSLENVTENFLCSEISLTALGCIEESLLF